MITKFKKPVAASGSTIENEPVIKSDGASSDVMEWQASTGSSRVEIREDSSNNLKLEVDGIPVASGLAGIDGQGLHFDTGSIDIASPPDLGTKFSYELIIQSDAAGVEQGIIDFYTGGRLWFGIHGSTGKLAFYDTGYHDFSVLLLDDLKVHHLVMTVDGTAAILYDNGNQVSTVTLGRIPDVDACTDAMFPNTAFDGTFYRCRFWNKTLTAAEVTASFEQADVPFADQYGSQTTINSGTTTSGLGYRITARDGVDFTTVGAEDNNVGTEFVATGSVTLDANDTVVRIGAVADYELSANPTQSTMVQDRAGAADGTSSASGVTQVTPIVQVNATAARIGTTAATPADGDLLVSGYVGVGLGASQPSRELEVSGSGNVYARVTAQSASDSTALELNNTGGTWTIKNDDSTSETLTFGNSGGTHLAIASTGIATFSKGIAFQSATTGTGTGTGYTLDAYEVGTFTPVVADAGTGGNAASAGAANGRYTKVGNRVYCQVSIINITTTGLTAGNLVYVRGLPFTSTSTVNFYSPVEVFQGAMTSTEGVIHGLIHPNTDYMSMYNSISGAAGSTSAIVSQITSGSGDMYMSFQYETAL